MIRTLGTEFVHFFLLEREGEVTPIDVGLRTPNKVGCWPVAASR